MRIVHVAFCGLLLAAPSVAATKGPVDPAKALAGIRTTIEAALADQKIPGAAVGVIVGDRIVLLEGFGQRDLEAGQPMTPDTMMPIASVSKQFTVAALGTLARQGKLDWDAPVRDVMPDFRLHDDFATLRATPRDLVTHRIGMPRHDAVWYKSDLTRSELYGRLRYLQFNKDMRTKFQYNNFMFMTAGYLGGKIAGSSYEDLVRTALFEPLGMTRTNFELAKIAGDADGAHGYQLDNDRKLVRDEFESAEQMAPTGGINSTARDLVTWLRMLLAGGMHEGKRVLLEADVDAMMAPQMPIGPSFFPEFGYNTYGMGFFVGSYRGLETASHGGNMPGAATMVLLLPKEKIGVVVLTNRSGAGLRDSLPYEIVDRLQGLPSAGLIARYAELEKKGFAGEDEAKAAGVSDRVADTKPSHRLEQYAGHYSHPGYGPLEVKLASDGTTLELHYNSISARLDHWHYDVFQAPEDRTSDLDRARVQFVSDLAGEVSGIAVPVEPRVDAIVFARQPPPEMTERAFLDRLAGTYEVSGFPLDVWVREDGKLFAGFPGTTWELVPLRGTTFKVKERTGVSVEFLAGPDGTIDRIAWYDGGSSIGKRKK